MTREEIERRIAAAEMRDERRVDFYDPTVRNGNGYLGTVFMSDEGPVASTALGQSVKAAMLARVQRERAAVSDDEAVALLRRIVALDTASADSIGDWLDLRNECCDYLSRHDARTEQPSEYHDRTWGRDGQHGFSGGEA